MKRQYAEIKSEYKDCLLFFRLGDFYELFDDDAIEASALLDLTLTTRDRGKAPEEQTPMCGVPYHAAEAYIAKLIQKGKRVAICEQVEDPKEAVGIVRRDVIRVITPGTLTDDIMLDESRANYICAVYIKDDNRSDNNSQGAVTFCEVSSGELIIAAFNENAEMHIANEMGRFSPREVLLFESIGKKSDIYKMAEHQGALILSPADIFAEPEASAELKRVFPEISESDLFAPESEAKRVSCGALLLYLKQTQKCELSNIKMPVLQNSDIYMELDYGTLRGLELLQNQRSGDKKGSLLWVLDKTVTSMGARMLRSWIERPLISPVMILRRQAAVAELFSDSMGRQEIRHVLSGTSDLPRLISRATFGTANARDLMAIADSAQKLPEIKNLLKDYKSALLREICDLDELSDIRDLIKNTICDEPAFSVREGGIIRPGFSAEIDRLRELRDNGAMSVAKLEERERERTGIKKLKVGYNKVFGYYIDVPNSARDTALPEEYIRKQTLVSNERYITEELKELESALLSARDRIVALEYEIFANLLLKVAAEVKRIQKTAEAVSCLDALASFAHVAVKNGYCMPTVDLSGEIIIKDGRHPVVEESLKDSLFVPNDVHMNMSDKLVAIVTGPNMAGKSTYMRQTALIVLMAQMGSFVPAGQANIGAADRVFTRIGSSDDISAGQSTFMVEMTEVAQILKSATSASLIILDEIGRGTSTYDGMAIARAVLEHCANPRRLGAKTMFATHYHELTVLDKSVKGAFNLSISAKRQGGELKFLRRIVKGPAAGSYGIDVARLAGVPGNVISAARQWLRELEAGGALNEATEINDDENEAEQGQLCFTEFGGKELIERLKAASIETMTPIEALNFLYKLKGEAERI